MANIVDYTMIPGYGTDKLCSVVNSSRHIYVVSDGSFEQNDCDIHGVAKIYVEIGAGSLPYHYVIKHCETNAVSETGTPLNYAAGTIFQTKDTSYQNGMTDADTGRTDRRILSSDIVICTTLTSGVSLNATSSIPTKKALMDLLKGLICELGVTPDYIHNWYNYGDGSFAVDEASFKSFIIELKKALSVDPNHVGVYDSEDNAILVLSSIFPEGATLDELARVCVGQSASVSDVQKMKVYLSLANPSIWPTPDSKNVSGSFVNIASGNVASAIVSNLKARGIYYDMDEGVTNTIVDTLRVESVYNQILSEWQDPSDVHRTGDSQTLRTTRGGKSEQLWRYSSLRMPGYHNARLQFDRQDGAGDAIKVNFLVSPSDVSESRSNNVSNVKTLGGWVGQRLGKNPIQIRFTGYMLDIKKNLERHNFLNNVYKKYLEDQKNENYAYFNEYRCKLIIEGREYYGYVTNLSFSKDAKQPFLYSYNISFIAYNDKYIYNPDEALVNDMDLTNNVSAESNAINGIASTPDDVYTMLNELVAKGLLSTEAATAFKAQLSALGVGTENYYNAVATAEDALQYYMDSRDWSKQYLQWFLTTTTESGVPYISSVDSWMYPESYPKISDTIALLDRMTGPHRKTMDADANKRWDQPYITSLIQKQVLRDRSSWLTSDNAPKYAESERMSRGLLCAVCDYIHGIADFCAALGNPKISSDDMTKNEIIRELKQIASNPSLVTWHWSYQHIYSLVSKGCMSTPIDDYWFEDPDATVSCEYELALLYKAYHKMSTQQSAETFLASDSNEAILKCHALKYVDMASGGTWESQKANAAVRWDAPHIYSLHGKTIIRDVNNWVDYNTSVPKYTLTAKLSKAEAVMLCDFINGDKVDFGTASMTAKEHVESLIQKGVLSETDVSYWLDDPDSPCATGKFEQIITARM